MSFALPSVKSKFEYPTSFNDYYEGSSTLMVKGFSETKDGNGLHPLIQSEKNYRKNKDHLNMVILRNTQGLHAPLRIGMELKAMQKVGHMQFLPRSNAMLDSLTGRDIEMLPEDVFNTAEFSEVMGQPHAVMEKNFGLLPL